MESLLLQSISLSAPALLIQACVDKLCAKLAEYQAAKKSVVMVYAYANFDYRRHLGVQFDRGLQSAGSA